MSGKIKLAFKKLSSAAFIPAYAHEGDSGMDLRSPIEFTILPNSWACVPLDIAAEIPQGYELQIRPRSGLAARNAVVCSFGTVDGGYRGNIGVTLFNHGQSTYTVMRGDKVAQAVLAPVAFADITETQTLTDTERGEGGFGSTGR